MRDRNRITGGGVTAGIDFGLTIAAELRGLERAQFVQLIIEYAPNPPFNAGLPETAPKEVYERLLRVRTPAIERARAIAERVGPTLG